MPLTPQVLIAWGYWWDRPDFRWLFMPFFAGLSGSNRL